MTSKTGNAQTRQENQGSSSANQERQQEQSRSPGHSGARDRAGRKGGDNAKNL